jgi:hypothetical protein
MTRDTKMLLLGLTDRRCTSTGGQVCTAASAIDPRIDVGAGWELTRNFALLVKEAYSANDGSEGVETRVQLVHGPLDDGLREDVDERGVVLQPGRCAMWLHARTTKPVGDLEAVMNPVYSLPGASHLCRNLDTLVEDGASASARGGLNEKLFTMTLWTRARAHDGGWRDTRIRTRKVPLGALGSDGDWNRFYFRFEVPEANWYWLTYEKMAGALADVEFAPTTGVVRNPDVSELKVATRNMLWEDYEDSWSTTKYRNAANLLASRGIIDVPNLRVIEAADQGPFEWDADIISLQETVRENDVKSFRDEASANSLPWEFSLGMAENPTVNEPIVNFATRAATLVAASLWPLPKDRSSIWFKQGDQRPPGCTGAYGEGAWDGDEWIRCHLPGADGHYVQWHGVKKHWGQTANCTIPAKAATNRPGGIDRPVAVFSVHLNTGDADGANDRRAEVLALIVRKTHDGVCGPFSVTNGAQCLGVEMWHDGCSDEGTWVPNTAGNYRPHHAMCPGRDQPGRPAVRTDHRPAGVRLRIFGGGSNPC